MSNKKNKNKRTKEEKKPPFSGQENSTVGNGSLWSSPPAGFRMKPDNPGFQEDVNSGSVWDFPSGGGSGYLGGGYLNNYSNYYGPSPPNENQPPSGFGSTVKSEGVGYQQQGYHSSPPAPEQTNPFRNGVMNRDYNYQDGFPRSQNTEGFMEPKCWTPPEWNPDSRVHSVQWNPWCFKETSFVKVENPSQTPIPKPQQKKFHPPKKAKLEQKILQIFRNQTDISPKLLKKIRFPSKKSPSPYSPKPVTSSESPDILAATLFQSFLTSPFTPPEADLLKLSSLPLHFQLMGLVSTQTLSPDQLRLRWQVCFDLFYLLRPQYPNVKVEPRGSLLTGLTPNHPTSSKTGVDIVIHLQLSQSPPQSLNEDVLKFKSILGGKKCPHTKNQFLKYVTNRKAGGTTLEFIHCPSKLVCKLTFEEDSVNVNVQVQKSKSIQRWFSSDSRIQAFFSLLLYWARHHRILEETEEDQGKISVYDLFLLMESFQRESVIQQERKNAGKPANYTCEMVLEVMGWMELFWGKYLPGKMKDENMWGQREHKVSEEFQRACMVSQKIFEGNRGGGGVLGLFFGNLWKWKKEEIAVVACKKKVAWQATFEMDPGFVEGYMRKLTGKEILEGIKLGKLEEVVKGKMEEAWKIGAKDFVKKVMGIGLHLVKEGKEGLYRVTYPFWRDRMELKYVEGEDPLVMEENQSKIVRDLWNERVSIMEKIKKEVKTEVDVENLEDKEEPPRKRVKLMEEEFKEFTVEVMSEMKVKDGLPCLNISILESTPESDDEDNQPFQSAVASLAKLFGRTFAARQIYQLRSLPK